MKNATIKKSFTLVEIILVVAVIAIIAGGTFSVFSSFVMNTFVDDAAQEIIGVLRKANTNSMARLYDLRWGVYFDAAASRFTFFAGESFAVRNPTYDEATNLPASVTISNIAFNGGGKEVLFRKIAGGTAQYGSIRVRSVSGREHTITINELGQIEVD